MNLPSVPRATKVMAVNKPTPITEHPEYQAARAEIEGLAERSRQAEQRRETAIRRRLGERPKRSVVARAQDLLRGGHIPAADAVSEIDAANEELAILSSALAEAHQRFAEIIERLSADAAAALRPAHAGALREALAAMAALNGSVRKMIEIRDSLIGAGYSVSSVSLACPLPPAVYMLGDPAEFNSGAARFARNIEQLGF